MGITRDDIGRLVRLRNGDTTTISGFVAYGTLYKVRGKNFSWTQTGRRNAASFCDEHDIIGFVDEEGRALEIAEKDVGRRVRLRDGRIGQIVEWENTELLACVRVGKTALWYMNDGGYSGALPSLNIVEFVDKEAAKTLRITPNDVGKLVKLRDGQVGYIEAWDGSEVPVCVRIEGTCLWHKRNGMCCSEPTDLDIVGFGIPQEMESGAVGLAFTSP